MKFYHLNGHNPDSPSAKARKAKEEELLARCGVVKCEKCGETSKTLYKINDNPKQYLCADCKKA